jgi:hypothetical protein
MVFGKSLSQQTPAEGQEQGSEPDGKWDYKRSMSWDLGSLFASKTSAEVHEQGPEPDGK